MPIKPLPSFINQAQATCLEFYACGEHENLLNIDDELTFKQALAECGDGLLKFIITELSSTEDCTDTETAIGRITGAIEDLNAIRDHLENSCDLNKNAPSEVQS